MPNIKTQKRTKVGEADIANMLSGRNKRKMLGQTFSSIEEERCTFPMSEIIDMF